MIDSMLPPRRVAIVLVDGFALMSFSAVSEPLRAANLLAGTEIYRLDLFRAASKTGPASASAAAVAIDAPPITTAPDGYDLAIVVAGGDPVSFHHAETFQWLRRQARHGHVLAGVSGGPAILANAGLMESRRMTIHWEHAAALAERHPSLMLERGLYVVDRDRLTCAGGTAPLDMMHALIAEHHGGAFARLVSDWFMHTDVRPAGGPQRAGLAERYGTTRPVVLAALEAMDNHIADPLSLKDLAAISSVGERQMTRQFHQGLGHSPGGVYRQLRLDKSRELLRQTDLPMTEIAIATGFSNAGHYATAFRKRYGLSPRRYRQSLERAD